MLPRPPHPAFARAVGPRRRVRAQPHASGRGCGDGAAAAGQMYDPGANRWSPLPALSSPRRGLGLAALAGHLYAVGGWDGKHNLASAEGLALVPAGEKPAGSAASTPRSARGAPQPLAAARSWRRIPDMKTARSSLAVASVGGCVIAAGGWDGAKFLASVECYEPLYGTQARPAPPRAPRRRGPHPRAHARCALPQRNPVGEWRALAPMKVSAPRCAFAPAPRSPGSAGRQGADAGGRGGRCRGRTRRRRFCPTVCWCWAGGTAPPGVASTPPSATTSAQTAGARRRRSPPRATASLPCSSERPPARRCAAPARAAACAAGIKHARTHSLYWPCRRAARPRHSCTAQQPAAQRRPRDLADPRHPPAARLGSPSADRQGSFVQATVVEHHPDHLLFQPLQTEPPRVNRSAPAASAQAGLGGPGRASARRGARGDP